MTLFEIIDTNGTLSDHDLAVLADWANEQKNNVVHGDWKRAFALLREGADLVLRRRARSSQVPQIEPMPVPIQSQRPDYADLRRQISDYQSTYYGPHPCQNCRTMIVEQGEEFGGKMWELPPNPTMQYRHHACMANAMAPTRQ